MKTFFKAMKCKYLLLMYMMYYTGSKFKLEYALEVKAKTT